MIGKAYLVVGFCPTYNTVEGVLLQYLDLGGRF
jgi:hypothetical protein